MIAHIKSAPVDGIADAPPSKSSMQRAVAASLLANGKSTLLNPSYCDDSLAALEIAKCLGAKVDADDEKVIISGGFNPSCTIIDCNESGLSARLFSAVAALHNGNITISGRGSIMNRPMDYAVDGLRSMGAFAESSGGLLPLRVKGPLKGGTGYIDGSVSSQFLTGLLMALPLAENDSRLFVSGLASKPYIDLTLDLLAKYGIEVRNENYEEFYIPGNQIYRPSIYSVEGDWSGASALLVLGATAGRMVVNRLQPGSTQADSKIVECLRMAGAVVSLRDNTVTAESGNLEGFSVDISDSPDLAPSLAALAVSCEGKSVIKGTSRLKVKESDRGRVLESEFRKLGVDIVNREDSIEITGRLPVKGGRVSSFGDHRIAMALALLGAVAKDEVIIEKAGSVHKSYPGFFREIEKAGLKCTLRE